MSFIEEARSMLSEELFSEIQAAADDFGVPFAIAGYAILRIRGDKASGMSEKDALEKAFRYIDAWKDKLIDCEVGS